MKIIVAIFILLAISACSNTPQRYSISTDNNMALKGLKTIGVENINVGSFTRTAEISNNCRLLYGNITLPDKMSFEGYIQKGLVDELKVAGIYNDKNAQITLTGVVEHLAFSTLTSLIGGGSWDIGLRINSSNGKSTYVSEHYEFDASGQVWAACSQTANAYTPAVQNILGKLITSPDFRALVTPVSQVTQPNNSQSPASAAPSQQNFAVQNGQANTATGTSMNETVSQKLRELQGLRKEGIITEDEFQRKKQQLLEKL